MMAHMEYGEVKKHVHFAADGTLTIDAFQLPPGHEYPIVDHLTKAINNAIREARAVREQAEHDKAMDPATYGLTRGGLVRIGNGKVVWKLYQITSSWSHHGRYEAILYAADGSCRRMTTDVKRVFPIPF